MDPGAREDLLVRLFLGLRGCGLALGIAELIAAREALAGGLGGGGEDGLGWLLRLLWCRSAAQNAELDTLLHRLMEERQESGAPPPDPCEPPEPVPLQAPPADEPPPGEPQSLPPAPPPQPAPGIGPMPVRAPQTPDRAAAQRDLILYDPISRRAMAQGWRHLRRLVKDGPCDLIDLDATVERSARLGWYDGPVLERRATDRGHLVLLVDQGGSMVPFHRLTRDLVHTVAESSLGQVDIAYFQNVPADEVYLDPHRTRKLPLDLLLADCTPESGLLLVSDAGAARGALERQRFAATARLLVQLKRQSHAIAWLNPVPSRRDPHGTGQRWAGSTAQLIAAIVPMFPMDEDGFGNAMDVLRGQTHRVAP